MKILRVMHDYINDHIKKNPPNADDVLDIPDIIDMYTYDDYESSNPLRIRFMKDKLENSFMKKAMNTTQNIGAEVISAYTNPYYIPHKIINLPNDYKNVVETYKKYSTAKTQSNKM